MKRTILIIHPGALGDVLLAVPAIRSLRVRFPQHETVLVASAAVSRLLVEWGLIDGWVSQERQACLGLFSETLSVSWELRAWLDRCDLAVAWMEDEDGARGARLRELGVVRVLIQSPFSTGLRARHQSDRFLETLGEIAADISSEGTVQIPTYLLEQGRDCLDAFRIPRGHPLVLVHPGSGSIHKCHEPRGIAVLIERLQQEGMCPLLLEGPADHDAVSHVLHFLNNPPRVLRDLDLSQLAGVLAHVTVYIGHDSGVTHLSALLGVRTIAIFGPTDHHRWAPRGSHVMILRGASCSCESWDAVKKCTEKPCLHVPIEELYAASELTLKVECANPRNSS